MAKTEKELCREEIIKILSKHYKEDDWGHDIDDEEVLYSHAITEEQLHQVLAIADHLINLVYGEECHPFVMTTEEREEYLHALQAIGHSYVKKIEPIPFTPELSGRCDWLLTEEAWHKVIRNTDFDREQFEAHAERLYAATGDRLPLLRERCLAYSKSLILVGSYTYFDGFEWMISSAANMIVDATGEYSKEQVEEISTIFPFLLKWPVLGENPGEPGTLCVLVK